jgi:hypothetical protein
MRKRSRVGTVVTVVVLLAVGCRDDGATGPRGENFPAMPNVAGQCLAPPFDLTGWRPGEGNTDVVVAVPDALPSDATTGPALVRSRLASVLVADDPAREIIASRPRGVVCLSREDGRWLLRRALTLNIVAE